MARCTKIVPPLELYDLEADPGEEKNPAEAHPEIVSRIEELLRREHVRSVRLAKQDAASLYLSIASRTDPSSTPRS